MRETLLDNHEMGTGAWAWGDTLVWGYGKGYADTDIRAAFDASIAAGVPFFDTAELYGFGKSEKLIGGFLNGAADGVFIATKFFPLPWRFTVPQWRAALKGSLRRLGLRRIDLYQIHWPTAFVPEERWSGALADALDDDLIRLAGVSNYHREQTIRAAAALERRGHRLASNQVEYSLIERAIERNGVMETCAERGVKVIAYSPLGMGLLTGKYSADNPPPGFRGRKYSHLLLQIDPLIDLLKTIGAAHGGKTPAQVALNWTICKGTLPIPGAKTAAQAQANAGAIGWRLTADEIAALDEVSSTLITDD